MHISQSGPSGSWRCRNAVRGVSSRSYTLRGEKSARSGLARSGCVYGTSSSRMSVLATRLISSPVSSGGKRCCQNTTPVLTEPIEDEA